MDERHNEDLNEDVGLLISRLGLVELVRQLSGLAKSKCVLSDKGLEGSLTEEEQQEFKKADVEYHNLESILREKFREHNLSDDQTAVIMDHIWTSWLSGK
jgi:VIT1/CCC1 family predicted Fe2+/Mn2+ transporter